MELKEFVSTTLTQIIEGVVDAQKDIQELELRNVGINPKLTRGEKQDSLFGHTPNNNPVVKVDFKVAVEVKENSEAKESLNVVSCIFPESDATKVDLNQNILCFSIPISYPVQPQPQELFTNTNKDGWAKKWRQIVNWDKQEIG